MPPLFPFVEEGSYYDQQSSEERAKIESIWRQRDRSTIRTYPDLLTARGRRDSRLACSRAIAGRRRAIDIPDDFDRWIKYQATVATEPRHNGCIGWAGPSRARGAWAYDSAPWRLQMTWGFGGWEARHHFRTDSEWDGVSLVPKTPGKMKRRRAALRALRQAGESKGEHSDGSVC
ncbi:hypothetical protein C8R43DRAFT_1140883 [Mycena crocata]|nr:hypothetical protein C8R43DRAFT_1140883 [Mycena crocata]